MNKLIIPPTTNWYENSMLSCAQDNTLLYGSCSGIVIIHPNSLDKPADIDTIPHAHNGTVKCVLPNPNWGNPDKLAVSVADDKVIHLWNINELKIIHSNNAHSTCADNISGATFAGNEKVVSVSEHGFIVIWKYNTNEINGIKDLLGYKVRVSCISSCIHAPWLTAFGLKNGLVILTDLRKSGKILYKLRGHEKSVISFSWCPTPINIFLQDTSTKLNVINKINDSEEHQIQKNDVNLKGKEENANECNKNPKDISLKIEERTSSEEHKIQKNDVNLKGKEENADENIKNQKNIFAKIEERTSTEENNVQNLEDSLKYQEDNNLKISNIEEKNHNVKNEDENNKICNISTNSNLIERNETEYVIDQNEPSFSNSISNDAKQADTNDDLKDLDNTNKLDLNLDKQVEIIENSEIIDKNEDSKESCSIETSKKVKVNPWINLKHADDDEIFEEDEVSREMPVLNSFLEECNALKHIILQTSDGTEPQVNISSAIKTIEILLENNDTTKENENNCVRENDNINISNQENTENIEKEEKITDLDIKNKDIKNKEPESLKEYLLASSSIGGSIYIWRAGTDGRIQKVLSFPKKTNSKNNKYVDKNWITLCWIRPNILLSSSPQAELIKWTFSSNDKEAKLTVVHNNHYSNLFSIAAPIKPSESDDDVQNLQLYVWTFGQDRYIINSGIGSDKKTIISYPTLGGQALCLCSSPLDPTRIAIGFTNNTVKIWDLSTEHLQYITMGKVWQKVHGKIFSLEFHPSKENILAYGTNEGSVGLINCINAHQPMLLPYFFRTTIFKLQWGPLNGDTKNLGLYVCANGKVIAYNINKPLENPICINSNEFVTDFAWKPDYSLLAMGTKVGSIELYSTNLKLITNLYLQRKPIVKLIWHPEVTAEDENTSIYANWLALFTNENFLYVYDISQNTSLPENNSIKMSLVNTLESNANVFKCICWSPHESGTIAYAIHDGIAEIWDVKTNTLICTYVNPSFYPILTIMWSPLDKHFIITGNKDQTIKIFDIRDHPPKDISEIKKQRKSLLERKINLKAKDNKQDSDNDNENKSKKLKWSSFLHTGNKMQSSVTAVKHLMNDDKAIMKSSDENNKMYEFLKIYGEKADVINLLNYEQLSHIEKNNHAQSQHLSLWKGDLNESIKTAIEKELVTPWMINMAPMVSPLLWHEACATYAKQLAENEKSNPHETASYFLACHKIEEAIQVLCAANLYKDALAIAKCRLASTDPIIKDIVLKWGNFSLYNGALETAAQCYVALKRYEDAAKTLFKKNDFPSIELALDLVKCCDNKELQNAILLRYNTMKEENDQNEIKLKDLPSRAELIIKVNENGVSYDDDDVKIAKTNLALSDNTEK